MTFNYVGGELNVGYDGLVLALFMGIYPVIIDTTTEVIYTVGKGTVKGVRIYGKEYWNQYSKEALLVSIISASQLGNNYKWFTSEVIRNIEKIQA